MASESTLTSTGDKAMANTDRGDELNEHNNDGQQDGTDNKYEPPHGILDMIVPTPEKIEDNETYDKGWNNGHDQR